MMHVMVFAIASVLMENEPGNAIVPRDWQQQAREAKTRAEHLAAAGHWGTQARALEARAEQKEREADELAQRKGYNPMQHKWPAMVQAPILKLRAQAMQARRAASEAREAAASHEESAAKAAP